VRKKEKKEIHTIAPPMITRASYVMNETMKASSSLVNSVHPTLTMARARMPFQQGLDFVFEMFRSKTAADVYSHPYFIEKATDPAQPSPQMHLTEEYQGIMKVMKGLRYMRDNSAKLDTTAVVTLSERSNEVFLYNPVDLDDSTMGTIVRQLSNWGVKEATELVCALTVEKVRNKISPLAYEANDTLRSSAEIASMRLSQSTSTYSRAVQAATLLRQRQTVRTVGGIILPTRQSSWDPLKIWAPMFPDAPIFTSYGQLPPRTTLAKFSDEEVATLEKRVRPLAPLITRSDGPSGTRQVVDIAEGHQLIRVSGDALTDEYVLHHSPSNTLCCTDLFHGGYSDFDPINTWLCRVFFKFQREGNYRRIDIPPRYKLDSITKQGHMDEFIHSVNTICRDLPWQYLVFAHGSPPLSVGAKEALLQQWSGTGSAASATGPIDPDTTYADAARQRPEEDFLLRKRRQ
jgi:hypothetical protein